MRSVLAGFVLMALLALPIPRCEAIADSLIVRVTGGLVQGGLHSGSVRFLRIPYGTAQRFQYPSVSVMQWSGVLNGSHAGPQCPQHCPPVIRDLYCLPDNQMSESCLTLNVFRPAYNLPSDQVFPVMLFIHGGGFETGSGAAPLYNGDYLARVGRVIVVTINYRLGAFGFLPIFNSYDDVIGNFGFRDQQVALHWVKQNIGNFDGDPNKVTLVGEEAGCQSVGLHLTSFTSDPLYHSAILHSCPFTIPFRSKNESRQISRNFAKMLGCAENDVTCLRSKPTRAILEAQRKISNEASSSSPSLRKFQVWGPIIDKSNVFDSSLLEEMMNAHTAQTKPIMIGFASEEGMSSVYRTFPLPVSHNYFQRLIRTALPQKWQQVVQTPETPYHSARRADSRPQMVRFLNHFVYICPAQRVAGKLVSTSEEKRSVKELWMYKFDPKVTWSPGGSSWPPGGESYCRTKACQGLDLLYLFNPSSIPESRRVFTAGLTRAMTLYWTNFAKYHNPNGIRHAATSSRSGPAIQGSLVRSRGVSFATPLQPLSVFFPSLAPRNINRSSRRGGGLQTASSLSNRMGSSSPVPLRGLQSQRLGIFRHSQGLPSMMSQSRHTSSRLVSWPAYFMLDPLTSSEVNVTLVLTQPSPSAIQSVYADVCHFWDYMGFQ